MGDRDRSATATLITDAPLRCAVTDDADGLDALRTVANYQFGAGAGSTLFPPEEALSVRTSSSGRPRQVLAAPDGEGESAADATGDRLVSYGTDGRLVLGIAGGRRLVAATDPPAHRVTVGDESDPYVREGRNAFAKFVRETDPSLRPGDEAVVVADGAVVGVGEATLWPAAMRDFDVGVAVEVRHGAGRVENGTD